MSAILLLIVVLATANVEASETCGKPLDLAFVVDASTSICGSTQPCDKWRAAIKFCKDIVNSLTIGPNNAKVAFITLRDNAELEWNFNKYTDKKSLLAGIDGVAFRGGELWEPATMSRLITDVFNPLPFVGTDRGDIQNIAILITDGAPKIPSSVYAFESTVVQKLRGVGVFVVCITTGCTEHCAHDMASPPQQVNETYFLSPDYLLIDQFRDKLVKKFCVYKA